MVEGVHPFILRIQGNQKKASFVDIQEVIPGPNNRLKPKGFAVMFKIKGEVAHIEPIKHSTIEDYFQE